MKLKKNFLVIIVAAVGIYAIFLFISDYNIISEKITFFQSEYLIPILLVVSSSWIPLILKWHLLLKKNDIKIPIRKSILIWFSGSALTITPGQIGELIKSQLIKNIFNISRSKTAPIIFAEKFYDLIGAIIVSIIGIIVLDIDQNLIFLSLFILFVLFFLIYYRPVFESILKRIIKLKYFSKFSDNLDESYKIVKNSTSPRISLISITLSISYWIIISFSVYLILLAFNIESLSFLKSIAIYPTSVLVGVASFIPGGIGVTEGSLAGLLTLQGIDVSLALVLSVIIRIFTMWFTILIGFMGLKLIGFSTVQEKS
tara:strand:- start:10197 stop:11138 length:942 start_codon:yes stop_codon:yes gene_type:complete